ncbi:MAG TPA: SPFH domain-containing protein [Chthonomonadaceae bacterium]|nr:SPFH domain-containing protein [Chthonomonadaceae bacterium]
MLKTPLRKILAVIVLIVLAFAGWQAFHYSRTEWIPAGHVGVIYDANSGLQKNILPPKAVYVGWRQRLLTYPTQIQPAIYTQDPNEGEVRAADGIQVTTNDTANTTFDVLVYYRVKKEDVLKAYSSFGAIPITDVQTLHIRRAVKEVANNISVQYNVFELMGEKRQEANAKMLAELQRLLASKGISVEVAMFGQCYPSQDIQAKINARVNAYTELEIARLNGERAEIERQIAVVKAEAENKARTLSASQAQGTSLEMLRLQNYKAALQKWDGRLPSITSQPGQTIVIGSNVIPLEGGK